jgi:hypothetical protein
MKKVDLILSTKVSLYVLHITQIINSVRKQSHYVRLPNNTKIIHTILFSVPAEYSLMFGYYALMSVQMLAA